MIFAALIVVLAFGVLHRCAGGFIGFGEGRTNAARLVWWAYPVAFLFGNPLCGLMAWLGRLIPHGWCQNASNFIEVAGLSAIGALRALLVLAPLALFDLGALWLALIGFLHGPLYVLGLKLRSVNSGFYYFNDRFAGADTEWCEFFVGCMNGVIFVLVMSLFPRVLNVGGLAWLSI